MNYMPVTVNSISVALGSKLVPPTQESEIIRKLFAGICTVEKKMFWYSICWVGHKKV